MRGGTVLSNCVWYNFRWNQHKSKDSSLFDNEPEIIVLPRIYERHGICAEDVEEAMKSMIKFQQRDSGAFIALGFDRSGRQLELVYDYDEDANSFTVFHAMQATKKFLKELGLGG